jgi:UDP-N-acetylglucosamine 4,6-dehydratase (inverting)
VSIEGTSILVTGGTGSFGQKFIKHVLDEGNPAKVIVYSRDELKQHNMQSEGRFSDSRLRFFIGDIRDPSRLNRAFNGVDIVIHAAALKQVPACEYNPIEPIKTNIYGAENIINAAIDNGVSKVIALSTDKATNPTNLYGATKLVMEKLFVQANSYSGIDGPKFSCVRYGNVVGSRGSVVPLFINQRETGKITLTDERMTRFFIKLQQGVDFVISSLSLMDGGEIFVPKIPSVSIVDLVDAIAPNCEVDVIGIRPGEKLHEVLVGLDESRHTIEQEDRFVIQPLHPWWDSKTVKGQPLESETHYGSENNSEWLSGDDLAGLLSDFLM